jgi:Response regulator of the LytR/AlgR family
MFCIAICDDEEYFRLREKKLVEQYMADQGYSCRIDLYPSGKDLLGKAEIPLQYDVIFLDISMEEIDGLQTAEKLREMSAKVQIVFVTAYITYALEGYKVGAVRYLLKEDESLESSLKECMDTLTDRMAYQQMTYRFDGPDGKRDIPLDSILYVESRLHKVLFFVREDGVKEYSRYDKLAAVETELGRYGFCRTHQSFLVNMKHVAGVERYQVTLENGTEINISKKYYKKVEAEYIRQQGEM